MKILAHRGFWNSQISKNSKEALEFCLLRSIGIQTDIRDHNGRLVISHDVPNSTESQYYLDELLEYYKTVSSKSQLALNIKSDGLSSLLLTSLERWDITQYFVFDMSVPEQKVYIENKLNVLTRLSELEQNPILIRESAGIWIDAFYSDWYGLDFLNEQLNTNKNICIVSPELHKRDYTDLWRILKQANRKDNLFLCTDLVIEADKYFNDGE